jgi:hypothetical protein
MSLTPAALLAELKILFSATGAASADRVTILTNCMVQAGEYVWNYAPWWFRHCAPDLLTVADQAYIALPLDFRRDPEVSDWIVEDDLGSVRLRYVAPSAWDVERARVQEETQPAIFTLGVETIADVLTPVMRLAPTPTRVLTLQGFHYFSKPPTMDPAEATDSYFPDEMLDLAWKAASKRFAAESGLLAAEAAAAISPWGTVKELLDEARSKAVWRGPRPRSRDVYGDSDDLAIPFSV